jgi:hypothetical protein
VWTFGDIVLDLSTNRAERAGQALQLTTREQTLLHFFLRYPNEVLSRTRLYEHVWQDQHDGLSNTLEVHVMELRRKRTVRSECVVPLPLGNMDWPSSLVRPETAIVPRFVSCLSAQIAAHTNRR